MNLISTFRKWLRRSSVVTDPTKIGLINVHSPALCAGRACVMHNPTDHHMSKWPVSWRQDRGIFERHCSHGVGHPDPDQMAYWKEIGDESQAIHGCCGYGCCAGDE